MITTTTTTKLASDHEELMRTRCVASGVAHLQDLIVANEPFAFLSFALGEAPELLAKIDGPATAATGVASDAGRVVEGKKLVANIHSSVLDHCGIGRVAPMPEQAARELSTALKTIAELYPDDYAATVRDFVSVFAWVSEDRERRRAFSSAAFPEVHGLVFVSRFAAHHLPPNGVFQSPCLYALCENIIHEALHHQLGALLDVNDALHSSARDRHAIEASWRGSTDAMTFEHALHAMWVYQHAARLRAHALTVPRFARDHAAIGACLEHAKRCADELAEKLAPHTRTFMKRPEIFEAIARIHQS